MINTLDAGFMSNSKVMKILASMLFMLFLSFLQINAQEEIGYVFNNRDDAYPENPDSGVKPIYWNNGVLYLGFCIDEQLSSYGITLFYYDTLGALVWQKRHFYPGQVVYSGYDIVALNNSSFYVGGAMRETWNSQYHSMLIKFNAFGDTVYTKVYPDSANKAINCMEKWSSDTILLCSKWDEDLTEDQKIVVEKVDTNGIICSTTVSEYKDWNPEQIIRSPSNLIFVGGEFWTETNNVKIFINVYDLNLDFLYTVTPGMANNERFSSFNILNNKVYMAARVTAYNPYPNWDQCKLVRLSNAGGTYGSVNIGDMLFDLGVGNAITLNDNCMVVPVSSLYLQNIHHLYFVDTNMSVICSTYVNTNAVPYNMKLFGDIAAVPGNKIAGTGYILADPNDPHLTQDHWNYLTTDVMEFMNQNCNEFTTGPFPFTENAIKEEVNIYPNPFHDEIFIELNGAETKSCEISIYNFEGTLIYSKPGNAETRINVRSLSRGLYFIIVSFDDRIKIQKIIKN